MHLLNRRSLHVAIIVFLGLIVYSNSLHAPFYWDDAQLTDFPIIKSFTYFGNPGAAKSFSWYGGFLSRYVGYLSFALNYRFHGLDVTGYHIVNVTIHLLSSLLVYRLATLTLSTPYFRKVRDHQATDAATPFIALFAALLFALHPMETQAVTYIVQRFASLATMFYLLAVGNYLKGRLALSGAERRPLAAAAWFVAALLAGALALKTKEISFTLPLVILLFEFLFFSREPGKRAAILGVSVLPILLLVATRVSGGSITQIAVNLDAATRLQTDIPRLDYLATQTWVILTYLRLLVLPVGQRLDYDLEVFHSFFNGQVLLSVVLLISLLMGALYALRRSRETGDERALLYRVVALGIFWFFITLSIESSIIPIVDVIFEHRVYLPSVGLFMAAAALVSLLGGANRKVAGWPGMKAVAGCLVALTAFSAATYSRNRLWSDPVAFWQDNAAKSPQKARVIINLARAKELKGDREGAQQAYRAATAVDPNHTDALLALGLLDIQSGRLDQALEQFKAALAVDPALAEAHNNIGKVYGMQSRYEDALIAFRAALQINPALPDPHNNIGFVYTQQKRYDDALQEYGKCLELDPAYDKAYLNRGTTLLALGRRGEAVADFRRALQANPSSTEAAQQLKQAGG